MLIFGASGHAKVIIECLEANTVHLKGCFDDDLSKENIFNYRVLGKYDECLFIDEPLLIAIGDNLIRYNISKIVKHEFGIITHPSAIISTRVCIGEGSVIFQGSIIQANVVIGRHCIINTKSSIDHDCNIGSFVHIAPGATLCGGITVGEGTLIGAGCIILPNLKIGKWCQLGAGSVVTKNVEDYSIIKGNPAK